MVIAIDYATCFVVAQVVKAAATSNLITFLRKQVTEVWYP